MGLVKLLNSYLVKHTKRERIGFLNNELINLYNNSKRDEARLCSIFIELFNGNHTEIKKRIDEDYFCERKLYRYISEGILDLYLGQREYDCKHLKDAISSLDNAVKEEEEGKLYIPFIHIRKAKAHRYLALYSKDKSIVEENFKISVDLLENVENRIDSKEDKILLAYICKELGDTYLDMKKYDRAEQKFEQAIQYDVSLATAYNGMGNYLRSKNEYEKAIISYNSALTAYRYDKESFRNNDECVYPLNYIGDCYRFIEDYEKAEEKYIEAIKVNPKHEFPWHGLGRVLYELGNRNCNNEEYYKIAIEYFNKSHNLNKRFKYVLYSFARAYHKTKDYSNALKYYNITKNEFPAMNYHYKESEKHIVEIGKQESLKAKINKLKRKSTYKKLLPEEKIIIKTIITELQDKVIHQEESFTQTFLKEKYYINEKYKKEVTLDILRRWNSYTPIIADGSKGGGYFIRAFGTGIVIDPGFNFIDNFKDAGYRFADIDTVFISHAHDDHTADLESIINLLDRYNKELLIKKLPKQIAKKSNTTVNSKVTRTTEIKGLFRKHRKILYLYISNGVMKKYHTYLNEKREFAPSGKNYNSKDPKYMYITDEIKLDGTDYKCTVDLNRNISFEGQEVKITAMKVKHDDVFADCDSLGFIIDFGKTVLIYTGDSGWNKAMEEQYKELKEELKNKDKYIILLAHIGGFKECEKGIIEKVKRIKLGEADRSERVLELAQGKGYLYKNHMGRIGIARINQVLEPNLCIISEFGEEFREMRDDVIQAFRESFDKKDLHGNPKIIFLPADIGLKINILEHKIRAINRIDRSNRRIIYDDVEPYKVKVGEYKKLNKLFYYVEDAGVRENDCLQAFVEDFKEEKDEFYIVDRHKHILKYLQNKFSD